MRKKIVIMRRNIEQLNNEELISYLLLIFLTANKMMLKRDYSIMKRDVSERTVCANLKEMINKVLEQEGIGGYFADVEYNRFGKNKKMIEINNESKEIFCDLIVHSRQTKKRDNLICLEMKKRGNEFNIQEDLYRLRYLTCGEFECENLINRKTEYFYAYALGIFYQYNIQDDTFDFIFYKDNWSSKPFRFSLNELLNNQKEVYEKCLKIVCIV